jgi:hypothetical protein
MMSQFIDIDNREQLAALLLALDPAATPLWGKMKPRQMAEHLVEQVEYSNGKKVTSCDRPEEKAKQDKEKWIYTDIQIPKNVFLALLPEDFRYPDLQTAVAQLMKELNDFDEYFKEPGVTAVHGGFGAMNHNEWLTWHGKHFTHHLKQFNLLPGAII